MVIGDGLTDSGSLGEIHFEQGVTLPGGFAAIARLKGGSRLFRSLDAAEWEGPHLPVLVERLFPVGGRVLGVGRRIDGRNVEVIESSDGREWTMWEPSRSLPFEMTVVDDVAEFDGGYVAGGFDRLNQTAVIWVSDDSYGWHRLRVDFGPGSEAMAIRAVDDAVFAVVTRNRSGYPPRIELWRSADAIEWAEVKGSGIDSVVPVGVTCNGGRLRVFAEVVGGGEDRRLGAWEAVLARREAAIA